MRLTSLVLVAVCTLNGFSWRPAWTLSLRSVGPVRLGSTIVEYQRAMGTDLEVGAGPIARDCGVSATRDEEVNFYTRNGRVSMATVYRGRSVRTRSGIGVGSSASQLMRAYPGRLTDGGEVFDGGGRYYVYVPQDPEDQAFRIVFHVDGGRVIGISVGMLPDILDLGESNRCYEG